MKLAEVFTDSMVFQHDSEIRIFGTCRNGERISAKIGNSSNEIVATGETFVLRLSGIPTGKGYKLTVKGDTSVTLNDVASGEVFLAAGQSNMQWGLLFTKDCLDAVMETKGDNIRYFSVTRRSHKDFLPMSRNFDQNDVRWKVFGGRVGKDMSGVAAHFAKKMAAVLDVPIGIVECNYGGSSIYQWLPKDGILGDKDISQNVKEKIYEAEKNKNEEYYKTTKEFYDYACKHLSEIPDGADAFLNEPDSIGQRVNPYGHTAYGRLYEAMVKTIVPFNFKGVIWYQGESDRDLASDVKKSYMAAFRMLERVWRQDFENEDLPFVTVQIAPFDYGNWASENTCIIKDAQEELSHDDNVYMICAGDVGEKETIHPLDKHTVGIRLANCALSNLYNVDLPWKSPVFNRAVKKDGEIRIYFDNLYGGLTAMQGVREVELKVGEEWITIPFWAYGEYIRTEIRRAAENEKERLTTIIDKATHVRFCRNSWFVTNLYNHAGLPALPFDEKAIEE